MKMKKMKLRSLFMAIICGLMIAAGLHHVVMMKRIIHGRRDLR